VSHETIHNSVSRKAARTLVVSLRGVKRRSNLNIEIASLTLAMTITEI